MRVRVAFTPAEKASAPVGIVVDVLRATSTIAQALASGYERILCSLSTTNGTSAILEAAARCDTVLLGSLLNLDALVHAVRERGEDVAILCAAFKGAFALDDAYWESAAEIRPAS